VNRKHFPWITLFLSIFLLLGFCLGCHSADTPSTNSAQVDDHDNDDDDLMDPNNDDDDDDDDDQELNVKEKKDIGADWDCKDSNSCIADYLNFIEIADFFSDPISEEELEEQFTPPHDSPIPESDAIPSDEFRAIIMGILNMEFLMAGFNKRLLTVIKVREESFSTYNEEEYLFNDPWVGTFKGILQKPKGAGPFPAVLAIHGHGQDALTYMADFSTHRFPEKGMAILALTMRANGVDVNEDLVTRQLLLNGFTFVGIRNYEALLGFKYLRWRDDIAKNRIGLIGHSGGSVNSNVLIRNEFLFKGYVSDCTGAYINDWNDIIFDDSVPGLIVYHLLINDFTTSETPVLKVPYGYEDSWDNIFNFFNEL